MIGRVIKCHDGLADVLISEYDMEQSQNGTDSYIGKVLSCCQKGIFRHTKANIRKILVGDVVRIEIDKTDKSAKTKPLVKSDKSIKNNDLILGVINEILPRKNFLVRPPIANLDILFVVVAVKSPMPDFFHIDKITAVACFNKIKPVIVINKTDIDDSNEASNISHIYETTDFPIIKISAKKNEIEKEKFYGMIENNICAFCGASGVGKTSIMNELFPELSLETANVSRKIQRGRHTTKSVDLYAFRNGFIADTPGFNVLDFERFDYFSKEDILSAFPDLASFANNCRYSKCSHIREEGCNVLDAVDKGKLSLSRHKSYESVYKQLSLKNNWSNKEKN